MENKGGRPRKPQDKKVVKRTFSISPAADANLQNIPIYARSLRVSRFLERMNPDLDARVPGTRLAPVLENETKPVMTYQEVVESQISERIEDE